MRSKQELCKSKPDLFIEPTILAALIKITFTEGVGWNLFSRSIV